VVEHATDILFALDLEGRLTSINAAGERFFGHDQGYLLGRYWSQTLAPGYEGGLGDGEGMHAILEELHAAGRTDTITVHSSAGQEIRILATRLELIRDE